MKIPWKKCYMRKCVLRISPFICLALIISLLWYVAGLEQRVKMMSKEKLSEMAETNRSGQACRRVLRRES